MVLTGEVDWHYKNVCLQISVSPPPRGQVNLFISPGEMENRERWGLGKEGRRGKEDEASRAVSSGSKTES